MARTMWSKACGRWLLGAQIDLGRTGLNGETSFPIIRGSQLCVTSKWSNVAVLDIRNNCRLVAYNPASPFWNVTLYSLLFNLVTLFAYKLTNDKQPSI
jgi:hypothetical protein